MQNAKRLEIKNELIRLASDVSIVGDNITIKKIPEYLTEQKEADKLTTAVETILENQIDKIIRMIDRVDLGSDFNSDAQQGSDVTKEIIKAKIKQLL